MGGRPAPTSIINIQELMARDNGRNIYYYYYLLLRWLAKRRLLHHSVLCCSDPV
jgi:hypothetical protein